MARGETPSPILTKERCEMEMKQEEWEQIDKWCRYIEQDVCDAYPGQASMPAELLKRIGSKLLQAGTTMGRIVSK